MAKRMPKTIYIKRVKDGDIEYFTADDDLNCMAEMNQAEIVGRYELKETLKVETVIEAKRV